MAPAMMVVVGLLLGLPTLAVVPAPATGQERDTTPPPPPPPPGIGGWGAVTVRPLPETTVVAATVTLPVGSAQDGDVPGRAWLLGGAFREAIMASLTGDARAATEVSVDVERSRTVFRLVTLPRYWATAWAALERQLFDTPPDVAAMTRARDRTTEVLTFEISAPVREFQLELYRILGGVGSAWSRPPRADLPSLRAISAESLTRFRNEHYDRSRAVVAVVGAVSEEAAAEAVTGDRPPDGGTLVDDRFEPLVPEDEAWVSGDRLVLAREVTSSWIGIAYPVDEETPRTALELLVHKLEESFQSQPPDPGLFHAEVRVEQLGSRPLLVLLAAVLPEATLDWERRMLAAVETVAGDAPDPGFFRWERRRFRSHVLLAEAAPEVKSLRMALDLLREGRVRDLEQEIWDLTPDDLHEAAEDLGPPRIVIFGPDLSDGGSPEP